MSRSGFRRPGRLAEVLSFEPPSMDGGNDKDDAKHSTNNKDARRKTEFADRLPVHEYDHI
jgi:hypothetical protein